MTDAQQIAEQLRDHDYDGFTLTDEQAETLVARALSEATAPLQAALAASYEVGHALQGELGVIGLKLSLAQGDLDEARQATATAEAALAIRDQDLADAVDALADKVTELTASRAQLTEARRQVWEEVDKIMSDLYRQATPTVDDWITLRDLARQRAQPSAIGEVK